MIRFLFRFLGLILLAAAFILVIYDGTKSIAGNSLSLTTVQALWELINPASLAKLKPLIVALCRRLVMGPADGLGAGRRRPGACSALSAFCCCFSAARRSR